MFHIDVPIDDIQRATIDAQQRIVREQPDLMETVGVAILSRAQLSYKEKARGGTGDDGITWPDIVRATIEARVRSRAPARKIVLQRATIANQIHIIQSIKIIRAPKSQKSTAAKRPRTAAQRKAAKKNIKKAQRASRKARRKARFGTKAAKIDKLRKKRKKLSDRLQGMVDKEFAHHEIGVDTGLQRAAGAPGFRPADGDGGNVFDVQPYEVTVGYGREYSVYFDERRPLMPDDLPRDWEIDLDDLVHDHYDQILKDSLE